MTTALLGTVEIADIIKVIKLAAERPASTDHRGPALIRDNESPLARPELQKGST